MIDPATMVGGIRAGNHRAAARAISTIENDGPEAEEIISSIYPHTGHSYAIGFTGPPGAGKSSLVDDIVHVARGEDQKVGIIAVDPNSPFSGGAILGDRIRMMRHTVDSGVFIRSMGSRGHLGGLSLATARAMYVLDAMGMDLTILETVGVGQSELEVAGSADTTIVVLMPGLGDSVQTIKAGIMEIADIYVINKSDHPALAKTAADLRELLRLDTRHHQWVPPIVKTIATREEGVIELWEAITKHRCYLEESGELHARRAARVKAQIVDIATRKLRDFIIVPALEGSGFGGLIEDVTRRRLDPFSAARIVIDTSAQATQPSQR